MGEVPSWDEAGNNPLDRGAVGTPLYRNSGTDYPDGLGEVLRPGANPRMISNLVVDQGDVFATETGSFTPAIRRYNIR